MPAGKSTNIPFGYCHCGCGQPAPLAKQTISERGHIKGQPINFISGHNTCLRDEKLAWFFEALRSHNSDDCLLWPFAHIVAGYGRVVFKGRRVGTHRLAFYMLHGHWPIPQGCHTCDTPACFNPRHIFEGTRQQNQEDMAKKLRTGRRKLTPQQVVAIRREYIAWKHGYGAPALARKYGVATPTIWHILNRTTWKHVA